MQKHTLNISTDLQLPQEVGTETIAILGRRGSGKSNTATVIAEELIRAGQQVVVIDPKGEAWGLKAQGDGGPGLDVIVFGDPQGDLPLRDEHGPVVADFVVGAGRSRPG
jgi:DNA helicase HerA-like ATPase